MFIKISKLEGVLKKAYKGAGIRIERSGSRLIVGTAYMYIEADVETASKDFKAAVVRYTGDLPKDGESYTINEDQSQINIAGTCDQKLFERDTLQGKEFEETLLTYNGDMVLQAPMDGQIVVVPMKEWQVYDPSAIDDGEDDPDNSWYLQENQLINRNGEMILVFGFKPETDEMKELQKARLV